MKRAKPIASIRSRIPRKPPTGSHVILPGKSMHLVDVHFLPFNCRLCKILRVHILGTMCLKTEEPCEGKQRLSS